MKRATGVVVLAAGVLVLAACSAPTHGTVTDLKYTPAHTSWTSVSNCSGSGKTYHCSSSIVPIYHGAEWEVCLRNVDSDGKVHTGCRDVDETTFHEYHVGDYYPRETS